MNSLFFLFFSRFSEVDVDDVYNSAAADRLSMSMRRFAIMVNKVGRLTT